jgi:mycofactocin glycosyltransferase
MSVVAIPVNTTNVTALTGRSSKSTCGRQSGRLAAVPSKPEFTVVIPTKDRAAPLARCLDALERQEGCPEFEIVVVDDGSSAAHEVAAAVAASPRARLVRTPPSGSAPARNRGIREGRTPTILLLDDDCEPVPHWAAALLRTLDAGADVAAGVCVSPDPTDPYSEATQTVLDYITLQTRQPDGAVRFAPTYNLGCRRELLLDEPFDEAFANSGADREWCARLVRHGYTVMLDADAVIVHRQSLDLAGFWRKHLEYGEGSAHFRRREGLSLERPAFYLGLVRAGFGKSLGVGLAVCLAQLATAVGSLTRRFQ